MEALFFDKNSGVLQFTKSGKIPALEKSNNVIIKTEYSAICGTDLKIIKGAFPCNDKKPFVLGHEFCGEIVEVGPDSNFKVGQRVVIDPNSGCGTCDICHNGNYHLCEKGGFNSAVGIWMDGGWAQYCQVSDTQVFLLPEKITSAQAALCEPLSCLARAWDRAGQLPIGIDILVLGAGFTGNLWSSTLHLQGHRNVTVSEPNAARLEIAKKMGFGFTYVQSGIENSGKLFDVIIDSTGVAKALEDSISLLKKSGKYILFGCSDPKDVAKINPFDIYSKESSIIGCVINPFTYPKAIGLIQSMGDRYLNYEKLGIGLYKLADYKEAMNHLKAGRISKAVFKFN